VPPGLSKRDVAILKSINKRAHYLDKGFVIPCPCGDLRFGWTFFIGIIPGAGDVVNALLNYFLVVRKAKKADIPDWLLRRMLFNNAVSAGIGFVPFAGDVFIAIWKTNSRNARLLEEFLRIRGEELLKTEEAVKTGKASGVDPKDKQQVKPGSGLGPKEKPSGVPKGAVAASDAPPSTSEVEGARERKPSLGATANEHGEGTKRSFSWLRTGSKGKGKGKAPAAGERGRFVENVDTVKDK
jgi:hypothetical protein